LTRSLWGRTPRWSIEAACDEHGRDVIVQACLDVLAGDEPDPRWLRVLAGPRAPEHAVPPWPTVWALRGLLWAWEQRAATPVVDALSHEAWRVREMAAKVVARHLVDAGLEGVVALAHRDPVARVRTAAARAVRRLSSN
jgi:hypothetical protein